MYFVKHNFKDSCSDKNNEYYLNTNRNVIYYGKNKMFSYEIDLILSV